jgi:Kef-type K+ transport system membrane component KefB
LEPLAQLVIIWCAVFFAAWAARRTRLTPVLWFLFAGAALVNLGVLPAESHPFVRGLAELGIITIMFALGFEENTGNFLRAIRRSWGISLFGAITPFTVAFLVAEAFWGDSRVSIMVGLAMTATAVSLTMVSLKSEGLGRTPVATALMSATVLDGIGSMVMLAILIPVATGDAPAGFAEIGWIVLKAALFFGTIMALALWVFPHEAGRIPFLRRPGVRDLFALTLGEHTTLSVLIIAVLVALLAHALGFHAAVGAYLAGLILKEEYFELVRPVPRDHYAETRAAVDSIAYSWIGPVFFVELGTKLVFDREVLIGAIPETAALTGALLVMQPLSAGLAARYTGSFSPRESVMIGLGMLGRAELAFVVMDIAYVEHAILPMEAFYVLMFTAFLLNVAVPLSIKAWKPFMSSSRPLFSRRPVRRLP